MSNSFWAKFPALPDLHCVEMKDRIQDQIRQETRNVSPEGIIAYFHDAACRFRLEVGRAYPESTVPLMSVQETNTRQKHP